MRGLGPSKLGVLKLNKPCLDGPRPHNSYVDGPRPHTSNKWPQATHFKLMAPGHTLYLDSSRPHIISWWPQAISPHTSNRWPQATDILLMAPGHTLSVDGPRPHTWCYLGLLKVYVACGHPFEVCGMDHQLKGVWPGAIYLKCVAWSHQLKLCGLGAYIIKCVA